MRGRLGGGGGGSGSSLAVADSHIFADGTSRDAYFVSNPDELIDGLFIVANGTLQKYVSGSWVDYTAIIRGPAGATGATGQAGSNGTDGADGVGVPVGGNTGQILKKSSSLDYDTEWGDGGSGSVETAWGDINGALSSQTDLQIALDSKSNIGHTHDYAASARGLPVGGSTGQILKKVDNSDFNTTWGDPVDADALVYKGAIDCSASPNYPAADAGDTYKISGAGHIGGASGPSVAVGDLIICSADSTATGDHATVGSHWSVIGATTEGGVAGPTSSIDGNFPAFSGTSGGSIVDSGTGPSSFLQKTLATAANLFLVSSAANTWAVKTIAEIKILLGLGGAAYLDVGTEAGSVCAGDDSRLSDARTPDSHGNESHSAAFLTTIDIHGTPAETSIADNDEILIYDTSASANRRMTRANLVAGLSSGESGGGTGISWTEITGTSQTAAVNTGYVPNNDSLVTITLPATAALGSIIRVAGFGAGGWAVAQNAGQQIIYGDVTTAEGVSGSLASINRYDAVELLCVVADTKFIVISGIGTVEVA